MVSHAGALRDEELHEIAIIGGLASYARLACELAGRQTSPSECLGRGDDLSAASGSG